MKKILISIITFALVFTAFSANVHAQSTDCPSGSANDVRTTACYEEYCSGQASEDTQACQIYAQAWINTNSTGNLQCASIDETNESQCCPEESSSPMCQAYDNYTNSDANNESGIAGQIGSGAGTPVSTTAINSLGNTGYATQAQSEQAIANQTNACSAISFTNLVNIAIWVKCIIGAVIIPGIFTLAFVVFLWGVFKFIRASDKADKDDSKQFIWMGLIGLFVMTSVWGIIRIFTTTLGLNSVVPTLQTNYLTNSSATTTTTTTPTQ